MILRCIKKYHTKYLVYEKALMVFWRHESDTIQPLARFTLPFQVETRVAGKFNLGRTHCGGRAIYVGKKGYDENYIIARDDNSCEMF